MLLYSVLNVAHAQWQTVTNGVTPSALRGGHEANGSALYIARVKHGNGVHMGKARPNSREAFIPFGGKELVLSNYEVFTGTGQWVKASANNFPANAIQGGYEADGNALYIARAVIDGGYHPGKARKNGDGFIPFGGVERIVKDYEVLTSNPVATITKGTYHIRSQIENKPMDVVNGHNANGNGLHLWDFHGGDAQQFTIEPSNEAGYYYIKTKWGRVLDIKDWSSASGATLYTWDFHGGDNQKWRFIDRGNGYYNIESKYRTYIDVKGGNSAIGTPIHMSDYSMWGNNIAQLWKLEAVGIVMTRFNPALHGFRFRNDFVTNFAGIDFSGLCGGMAYAALDYFNHNRPVPTRRSTPANGTPLRQYIYDRQQNSTFDNLDKWAELSVNPFGWRTGEFFNWGLQGFNGGRLQELRAEIDNGRPVPLGLYKGGNGGFVTHHQVLAIGYDLGRYTGDLGQNKEDLKIYVYDSNFPSRTMTLVPNLGNATYYYVEEPSCSWLTYFVDKKYRLATPPR